MMGKIYEFSERSTIEQEAREWLIRLDSEIQLTDPEDAALREWVTRSPAHRQELKRICKFWNRANILAELAIPVQAVEGHRTANLFHGTWIPWPGTHRMYAIVTILILCSTIALTSWVLNKPDASTNGIYVTAIGQQESFSLADSSIMQLNTDSQVQVDYSAQSRKIRLVRGEAHFDVAHDPDKPFEVYAGQSMVSALGTAFSVYLKTDDVKVIVTDGQVNIAAVSSVTPDDVKIKEINLIKLDSLQAGQSAVFNNTTSTIITKNILAEQELQKSMSWQDGYLLFDGDPLSHVIEEVNRYVPLTIEITDPKLKSIPVGGRFRAGDIRAIFDILEDSFGIQVVEVDEHHIHLQFPQE
jgi:transmembrane sensor